MPGNPSQSSRNNVLLWVLIVSLGFNAYGSMSSKGSSVQVLATAGNESFSRAEISKNAQTRLDGLDAATQAVLRGEAENWLENKILPKEAQARGITVQELLEQEVTSKVQATPEEVEQRLAHSPAADALPYPQVLKDIENDLKGARARSTKKAFVEGLYSKYQAQAKVPPAAEAAVVSTRFPVYTPPVNGDPSKGPADAPVTIEIYSDFMCPFSARFFSTMGEAEKQYPGKIRTIYHQFPLPFHQGSHVMSEASLCAQEQGKFWEFHDRLFSQQKGKIEKEGLVQIAQELGLDAPAFQTCLDSGKNVSRVDQEIAMGKTAGVSGTPGYLINGRSGFGAIPVDSLKPLIDWCIKPQGQYPGAKKPSAPGAPPAGGGPSLDPNKVYTLDPAWLKKSQAIGPENAPVTIVEFLDYNCPFCKRGTGTMDDILAKYKDKVRLISKTFPLPMHTNAMKGSVATLCAAEQGKFWEYRKELFNDSWGKQTPEDLKAAAKKLGLNESTFNACLDQDKTKGQVDEDMKKASALGAQGMPTYFINGTPVVGAQPAENFEKIIESKLAPAKK